MKSSASAFWSINALLILSFVTLLTTMNNQAYANHLPATQPRMFQEYCINYQYVGQAPNNLNVQCESSKQACEQRHAEYLAREDLQPTSECYRGDVGKLATVYCVDYQYIGQPPNPNNVQCERSIESCEQRLAEYQMREDLQPVSECYKHERQYVNLSEHPYLAQYQ
jgi:hypothetical protein